ncbi:DUF3173 family protein [Vagococcus zengguangii]|uniref:DUF3173 domain-containing protein n=1 Tax=Vagococcus zengguangii TaxID=2571750 RepID=A0A4D7CUY0_9ENTE|nr:DUF3173 family protein [Vagococcus zengguangii]QCI87114.1 DUF3173 domain-containing protein [Vagococcus zengguangii]
MNKLLMKKNDLMALGIGKARSERVIREAKQRMIEKGFPFYDDRRLGIVPTQVVEEILGISIINNNGGKRT